ncbi:MAG: papain-like cysteine protease family protein [Pygmaiobacter sp.]|nr:papain-like cysteine protease family protein [Pygmaiobacter sp.]
MKKGLSLLLAISFALLSVSCSAPASSTGQTAAAPTATPTATEKPKGETIPSEDFDENGGADAYANAGDNPNSRYYVNPDFYHMKSDDELTLIEGFKTMQQTYEWSCGDATALMVLNHFGKTDVTEYDLALAMGSHTDHDTPGALPGSANNVGEYGTNVGQLYDYFSALDGFQVVETSYRAEYDEAELLTVADGVSDADVGNLPKTFSSVSLYAADNDDNTENWVADAKDSYFVKWVVGNLKAGRPIMVEWADWDGHWQAIIGYDNNGTPGIGDDILIFADPYDTSDQWQDGYYYYPLERWFYMWSDRNVAPKPYQLQPYIIIDKA